TGPRAHRVSVLGFPLFTGLASHLAHRWTGPTMHIGHRVRLHGCRTQVSGAAARIRCDLTRFQVEVGRSAGIEEGMCTGSSEPEITKAVGVPRPDFLAIRHFAGGPPVLPATRCDLAGVGIRERCRGHARALAPFDLLEVPTTCGHTGNDKLERAV